MTEAEWIQAVEPHQLLKFVKSPHRTRKFRLFAIACCRRLAAWLENGDICPVLDTAERYADGQASQIELDQVRNLNEELTSRTKPMTIPRLMANSAWATIWQEGWGTADSTLFRLQFVIRLAQVSLLNESHEQARLVRDIFGNPFRPVAVNPASRSGNVLAIAQSIYDERAFDRMPILADALEDAGCTNADVLNHCRQPGEHVRGCWVVDLILGKE